MISFIKNFIPTDNNFPIVFVLVMGCIIGSGLTWWYQQKEIEIVKQKYEKFVNEVETQGKLAKQHNDQQIKHYAQIKEQSDVSYQVTITNLRRDVVKLRNARAASSFVPAVANSPRHPDTACFQRNQLERALQQFDEGVTQLIKNGDEAIAGLNNSKNWTQTLQFK